MEVSRVVFLKLNDLSLLFRVNLVLSKLFKQFFILLLVFIIDFDWLFLGLFLISFDLDTCLRLERLQRYFTGYLYNFIGLLDHGKVKEGGVDVSS